MSRNYNEDVLSAVRAIGRGSSFLDIPGKIILEIAICHGKDYVDVVEDVMKVLKESRIAHEISTGHEYHEENSEKLEPDELVGLGMISEGTVVMTTDEFLTAVRSGEFADHLGYGEFVSGNGEEFFPVRCNVEWIEEFRDEWPYVAWYR